MKQKRGAGQLVKKTVHALHAALRKGVENKKKRKRKKEEEKESGCKGGLKGKATERLKNNKSNEGERCGRRLTQKKQWQARKEKKDMVTRGGWGGDLIGRPK